MKHLNEDELLMSAFDDSDSMNLDELDQEQRKEFMALSGLKLDLKRLNDIPPCQLSSERLRRRILEQGIQSQKKAKTGWFWFASAGAVSCACMAAASVMIWNWYQPVPVQHSPALAMGSADKVVTAIEEVQPRKTEPTKTAEAAEAPSQEPRTTQPSRTHRRTYSRGAVSRPAGSVMTVDAVETGSGYLTRSAENKSVPDAGAALTGADAASITAPEAPAPAPEGPKTTMAPPMGRTSPVVIISQSPTAQSSAVESSGHVVFGG